MSNKFTFDNQLQTDMDNICKQLTKENAVKLVYENKKATEFCTNLKTVNGNPINCNYKFSFNSDENIYFLFDKDFKCQYIGKKGDSDGINYRLGLHLIKNTTTISSTIESVCNYLNSINTYQRIIYVITYKIEPSYMAEGVESYFIDYFRNIGDARWVLRK